MGNTQSDQSLVSAELSQKVEELLEAMRQLGSSKITFDSVKCAIDILFESD